MGDYLFRIQYGDGRSEERAFAPGTWRIGRERGDLVLGDASVSSNHGELRISPQGVMYADLGSSNGSFDLRYQRLAGPITLQVNDGVRLGNSVVTLLRAPVAVAPVAPAVPAVAQVPATVAMPLVEPAAMVQSAVPVAGRPYSHPEQAVRHSYPLAISSAGIGEAIGLLLKTMPFLIVRLGILLALSIAALVWWAILIGGLVILGRRSPLLGWLWFFGFAGIFGWVWRSVIRYFLYLIKAAHIAVLTELITTGRIGNGSESMFEYGKRIVKDRFGEVNVMFGLDLLIDGIVGAFNRSLNWVASLLPVPGLQSVMSIVNAILRASTTYIDETIFSYNLARGDDNVFRSSKDGLIYYAQNAKEILTTGLWVVAIDKVLTAIVWVVLLAPGFLFTYMLPGTGWWITLSMFVFAGIFAADIHSALLKPLFLTMVMVKFHALAKGQAINPEWDGRLSEVSDKFRDLKQKADGWLAPGSAPAGARAPQPV
jgi:type III secretion system (T3SS) inner membrane Yop/YscD-like protein